MSRRVYLAMLGTGNYNVCQYSMDGMLAKSTEYVQVAELELLEPESFDAVYIVSTEVAFLLHGSKMFSQMEKLGVAKHEKIVISDNADDPSKLWDWLYQVVESIRDEDELVFDLTHGWRMIAVVFSTAIHFIRKVRNAKITHVLYGMYDNKITDPEHVFPIVNLVDFYAINDWADGIGRVVDMADTRKLAAMVSEAPEHQFGHLADEPLVEALKKLGLCLTNINVNEVAAVADEPLVMVETKSGS